VDSVDSPLEAAVLRHITQLSAAPVVLDRPGGLVHSERELRIVIPRMVGASGESRADEAAAVAVEFGVLRGLLDLTSPAAKSPAMPAPARQKKWWQFFAIILSALFMFAGRVQAGRRPEVENECDIALAKASAAKVASIFQPLTARLKPCSTRLAGRVHADPVHRLKPLLLQPLRMAGGRRHIVGTYDSPREPVPLLPLRAVSVRERAVRIYGSARALTPSGSLVGRRMVRVVEVRGEDGAFLHIAAALAAPAQAQFGTSQINLALIGGAAVSGSLYDSGNAALKVNCVVGCGAAGFSDNAAFTAGSTSVNNFSAVFNDSITALTSGNAGALRATSDRMLYVNIGKLGGASLSGANVVDSGNTAFRVNCVVGCAAAGFTDNSGFTAGTTAESNIGGVFNDALAAVTSGNGAAARITASRALHVNLRNASGTEIGTSSNPVRIDPVGTTSQPVSGLAADGSATVGNPVLVAGKGSGNARVPIVCDNWTPISVSNTTATKLVTKATSKNVYICSINLVVAAASNVALIAGTQTTNQCDTSTAGLSGGTTAATGWNLAANGGLAYGNGMGVIMATASTGLDVCIVQSASTQLSGAIAWTQF
jgi:hypothetical protein